MASVAIIGELNLDLIVLGAERFPRPGEELIVDGMHLTLGSSSGITACQLARLGDDVLFVSKVGGDDYGRTALALLRERGVPAEAVAVDPALTSGLTISVAIGSERAMLTAMGSIEEMRLGDVDFERLRGRRHLHISSFYLQRNLRPDIWRILERARDLGLTTSLDTGWPSEREVNGDLAACWEHVDVLLPNEVEALHLSQRSTVDEALAWLAERVGTVAVKLGPEGAMARQGDLIVRRPGFAVDVVETTGAGDSFNGGFLHGWLEGGELGDCLDLGNACGALSTRAPGGTTTHASLEEAQAFIRTARRRRSGG